MRGLESLPPLVFAGECDQLKERLASVARGEAFLLQGGDCAETFAGTTADGIGGKLRTLLQMAVVLTYAASVPVVKVGRMAGQFAKPRSAPTEVRNGVELPVYRGDAVNGIEFTAAARMPDPGRLLDAYHCSSVTLNMCRAFASGGYADLRQVHAWNQDFVARSPAGQRYERLAGEIDRAIAFMHACGADPEEFRAVEFYSSHEALLLDYERALTRIDSRSGRAYDLSAHLLWIGERTRAPDGAHVQFARQVRNPVAVKIGPAASAQDVLALIGALDPDREPGRLTVITRMGAGRVREALPPLVKAVEASGAVVAWVCDPMHGNTVQATGGQKTRYFDDVLEEVAGFFEVHHTLGTHPGGIHIEFTGDDVTECLGGGQHIAESDLGHRYETACDPRLNRSQSLDLAFRVAGMYRQRGPVTAAPEDGCSRHDEYGDAGSAPATSMVYAPGASPSTAIVPPGGRTARASIAQTGYPRVGWPGSPSSAGIRSGQRRPPRSSLELVTEILGFMCDVALGELHDAHRERGDAVIGDDALADPQIPDAADPADREMPLCRVTAALCLDIGPTAETLTRLRVVQDRVGRVDGVLGFDIAPLGGVPVFCHPVPGPDVTVHGYAPPAERFSTIFAQRANAEQLLWRPASHLLP